MSNYIEKEVLHDELCKHLTAVKHARDNGMPIPRANDTIGRAIMDIANGLAQKHNFRNYSWLDEMVDDGILAAVHAINKYDPERSQNPFGYFTQCIYWAFQNRIKRENDTNRKKYEYMKSVLDEFHSDGADGVHHSIDRENIIRVMGI